MPKYDIWTIHQGRGNVPSMERLDSFMANDLREALTGARDRGLKPDLVTRGFKDNELSGGPLQLGGEIKVTIKKIPT